MSESHDRPPLSPPVLYILLALSDDELHGYAIMQEVAESTEGRIRLLPGSLYSTIKRMLADHLVVECDGPPVSEGPQRRYYSITEAGREAASAELARMAALFDFADSKKLSPRPAGGKRG